jgi:hypothetical protein
MNILDVFTRIDNQLQEVLRRVRPPAKRPAVIIRELIAADTEYDWEIPAGCKKFTMHCRDGTAFRISWLAGKVANSEEPYFTVKANTSYNEDNLDVEPGTRLYLACSSAAKVIEIIVWF